MKTQITALRSGTRNQILNKEVDYSILPHATSHIGHAGSTLAECISVWQQVTSENKEVMHATICGEELRLKACWSKSGKSVIYVATINEDVALNVFGIQAAKGIQPKVMIEGANIITVSNDKHDSVHVCPSLVTIL